MRFQTPKPFILSAFFLFYGINCQAKVELLETASVPSNLISKNIMISLAKSNNDNVLAVGERGHILNWQSKEQYNQEISPVSLLLTDIIFLSNGDKLAIGHDGAVITSSKGADTWHKLFDGFELIELKISLLEEQIIKTKKNIETIEDEDERDEASFALEDLEFALEDAINSKEAGPSLPLLSVTQTSNDTILVTGAYGTLLRSTDLGKTWQLLDDKLNNPNKFHLNSITSEQNITYIAGEQGNVFKSKDNGNSWQAVSTPYNGSLFGVLTQKNTSNLIAFGLKGNYFTSNDQGEHWAHHVSENGATLLGGHIKENGDVVLVGHGGTIVKLNIDTPNKTSLIKHSSGSAFSAVTVMNDQLIIVGQFGIVSLDNSVNNPSYNATDDKGVSQ